MSRILDRRRLFPILAEELKNQISQSKPYSSDYQLVLYASKDLEQWLKIMFIDKYNSVGTKKIEKILKEYPNEFRIFLKLWVALWIDKWRTRVRILSSQPIHNRNYIKKIKEGRTIFNKMEKKNELKRMVIQKLFRQGEICMVDIISENLIIEEIGRRRLSVNKGNQDIAPLPISILNRVSTRVSHLSKERGPLVYLKIKPNTL